MDFDNITSLARGSGACTDRGGAALTDDLRDRLTTALMDAMGCEPGVLQESRLWATETFCAKHDRMGWPCDEVTDTAEALLPLVRDEIADGLHRAATDAKSIHCGRALVHENGTIGPGVKEVKVIQQVQVGDFIRIPSTGQLALAVEVTQDIVTAVCRNEVAQISLLSAIDVVDSLEAHEELNRLTYTELIQSIYGFRNFFKEQKS